MRRGGSGRHGTQRQRDRPRQTPGLVVLCLRSRAHQPTLGRRSKGSRTAAMEDRAQASAAAGGRPPRARQGRSSRQAGAPRSTAAGLGRRALAPHYQPPRSPRAAPCGAPLLALDLWLAIRRLGRGARARAPPVREEAQPDGRSGERGAAQPGRGPRQAWAPLRVGRGLALGRADPASAGGGCAA